MRAFRQGDVLLKEMPSVPGGEPRGDLVLAAGEATGHLHRISEGTALMIEAPAGLFLQVTSDSALLVHEEHDPIELERGCYEILLQRSYDPGRILDRSD